MVRNRSLRSLDVSRSVRTLVAQALAGTTSSSSHAAGARTGVVADEKPHQHTHACTPPASAPPSQRSIARTVLNETFNNPILWCLALAMVISVSGLRRWLDPASPSYVVYVGWVYKPLQMLGSTAGG